MEWSKFQVVYRAVLHYVLKLAGMLSIGRHSYSRPSNWTYFVNISKGSNSACTSFIPQYWTKLKRKACNWSDCHFHHLHYTASGWLVKIHCTTVQPSVSSETHSLAKRTMNVANSMHYSLTFKQNKKTFEVQNSMFQHSLFVTHKIHLTLKTSTKETAL